jgi:lysophospholipase L1-like esterase
VRAFSVDLSGHHVRVPIRHLPVSARIALVVLGTLSVAGFWAYLLIAPPRAEPFSAPPGAAGTGAAMRVTFVGDAFTAPTAFGGRDTAAYPALLASRFGWQVTTIAEDGAGYVARGATGSSLPDDENRIAASRPDLIVVFAGRDDRSTPPDTVAAAARAFYDALRRDLPTARLAVVGPIATDATPPAGAAQIRDALAEQVRSTPGAVFVDPLAEQWFATAPPAAIAVDGQHPTDVGHRLIADRLGADLLRLGLVPAALGSAAGPT